MSKITTRALRRLAGVKAFPQPPIIPVRYPVVMMHGFGVVAALRRGGHLHDEAMNLRLYGVRAYAPNVAPYNTVRFRAAEWKERIEHIMAETGSRKINLIAHSMGGLDARYLISRMGMHEVVASLVTVSSPHHGSPIAGFLLDRPERLQNLVTDICNWLGNNALADSASDFLTTVTELTRDYVCNVFNQEVPDHPDVRYWSYAGRAGRGTGIPINPVMFLFNTIIYNQEGVNDGFVSVDSARWGTFLGTVDADHAREVGIQVTPGGDFKAKVFYRSIAEMLAREGF